MKLTLHEEISPENITPCQEKQQTMLTWFVVGFLLSSLIIVGYR